jgi:hypothetical protein
VVQKNQEEDVAEDILEEDIMTMNKNLNYPQGWTDRGGRQQGRGRRRVMKQILLLSSSSHKNTPDSSCQLLRVTKDENSLIRFRDCFMSLESNESFF